MIHNPRLTRKGVIIADRTVNRKITVKVLAVPGYRGKYRWRTSSQACRETGREFARQQGLTIKED